MTIETSKKATKKVNAVGKTQRQSICPFCHNIDTIRWGYRTTKRCEKPTRFCKKCKRKFTVDNKRYVSIYPLYVIKAAVNISMKLSLRLTSECIDMMFGFKPDHVSIMKWRDERIKSIFRKSRR